MPCSRTIHCLDAFCDERFTTLEDRNQHYLSEHDPRHSAVHETAERRDTPAEPDPCPAEVLLDEGPDFEELPTEIETCPEAPVPQEEVEHVYRPSPDPPRDNPLAQYPYIVF